MSIEIVKGFKFMGSKDEAKTLPPITGVIKKGKLVATPDKDKSILHNKKDGRCFLCELLDGDKRTKENLEAHHAIPGNGRRETSDKWGLIVYLCHEHHTGSGQAVHMNRENMMIVKRYAQAIFEKKYEDEGGRTLWMREFGKNYLDDEKDMYDLRAGV